MAASALSTVSTEPTDQRPLVAMADDVLLDEVLRIAAAVGCEVERVSDLGAVGTRWQSAPLVLLDAASVPGESTALPRRRGVLLVCKAAPEDGSWQCAFEVGAEDVLPLPDREADLIAALADVVEGPGSAGGGVVAVLGGRGGAGASVLAAATALRASRAGGSALLVDCDLLGGGVDLLLGLELAEGLRWPGLRVRSGRVSMSELDGALPSRRHGDGMLSLLSCDREGAGPAPEAVAAVVEAGRRAGRVVVCDLPRRPEGEAIEAVRRADLVVLVVPAEVRACVAAKRVLTGLDAVTGAADRARVVVRGPSPDGLTAADAAEAVGAPLLCWMRAERGLALALDRGTFDPRSSGPLGTAAQAILTALP